MAKFNESELHQLLNFIGYGRLDAPVWFLGMEERGDKRTLAVRSTFNPVEDLMDAHFKMGIRKHHVGKRNIQRTWRQMCYVMLSCDGESPSKEEIRDYQSEKLGRSNGETLLAELLPIPKEKVNEWNYEKIFPQFRDLKSYHEEVIPYRITYLREIFEQQQPQPKIVICYGKQFWEYFRVLFEPAKLEPDPDGIFERAQIGDTLIILCHHFTSRTMNKKIKKLARIVRAQND